MDFQFDKIGGVNYYGVLLGQLHICTDLLTLSYKSVEGSLSIIFIIIVSQKL